MPINTRRSIPWTIWRYIMHQYAVIFAVILIALLSLIYTFEVIELLRRASNKDAIGLYTILSMSLFKMPEVGMRIFPFAILFAGLFCFWRLTRQQELVVLRAAGISAWEFAMPAVCMAASIAILKLLIFNPIGAMAYRHYQDWDNQVLSGHGNTVALIDSGLWLRQANDDKSETVIHASNINHLDWTLQNVTILHFQADGKFIERWDAASGSLQPGVAWHLDNAQHAAAMGPVSFMPQVALPTTLTPNKIEEQYTRPDAVILWKLPSLIRTIAKTGLATQRLELYYYSLLSEPLLFMGLALLSVAFALQHHRGGGANRLIALGVGAGFALFFLRDFMRTLAGAEIIPISLAAWTPALLATMLGASILLYSEDG